VWVTLRPRVTKTRAAAGRAFFFFVAGGESGAGGEGAGQVCAQASPHKKVEVLAYPFVCAAAQKGVGLARCGRGMAVPARRRLTPPAPPGPAGVTADGTPGRPCPASILQSQGCQAIELTRESKSEAMPARLSPTKTLPDPAFLYLSRSLTESPAARAGRTGRGGAARGARPPARVTGREVVARKLVNAILVVCGSVWWASRRSLRETKE